jgi:predicted RNA-binding Zn ribbon-like protein
LNPIIMVRMAEFKLLGGAPCLDFTNTVDWRKGEPQEKLNDVHDLLDWALQAGIISGTEAERLHEAALSDPGEAQKTFNRAIRLREAIHGLFLAAAEHRRPSIEDLSLFNEELAQALSHMALTGSNAGFTLGFNEGSIERTLWTLTHSAAQLLTSPSLTRVKECGDPRCGWLYLDTSRNGTRRWCSMSDCGNRNKARRHYHRKVS